MNEQTKIKRIAFITRGVTIAAGAYTGIATNTLTANYNIELVAFGLSCRAIDTVTSQSIRLSYHSYLSGTINRDNPGVSAQQYSDVAIDSNGIIGEVPCYYYWASQTTLSFITNFYLESVTANNILANAYAYVVYLSPEDYLDVSPLKLS